ncbi:MAG TPA: sulfotransferase [Sphingomicrobium sp.]|nr:sulfotransferase [Sphingomicrobium sp.]
MAQSDEVANFRSALKARDRAAINRAAVKLLEQKTPLGEQWFSIAQVLERNGELALAISAAARGVEQENGSAKARFQLAHILSLVNRNDEAIELVSAIAPNQLNATQRDHFLGTCYLETGDFEQARSSFERVAAAWQGSGVTWLSLAALPPADDEALLDQLNGARPTIIQAGADSRARWHYARGTVLDRLGRTDEAFAEFAAGAKLVKSVRAYDPDADRREAEMLVGEFDREAIDRIAAQVAAETSRPILVTGLPRSGTTLVEQILTSHSQIDDGGELPFGSILIRETGGNGLPRLESFVSGHGADPLARLYLHLGDQRFGEGSRFVDKGLGASRQLGVLASVLPAARIIWLRRDPLDCAWSCFRTFFTQGIEWSWSLTDIAAHFQAEDELYAHWRDVLGERMLTLSYEELASNPREGIGRILDHVGLQHEPAMEQIHDTRRTVTTASVAQVRQPIHQSSVGSAHRYRDQLKPFTEAYEAKASAG